VRILHPADYRVMAWKNGGGTTAQLLMSPSNAADGSVPFDWRISIADVTADGPFSSFPGYDRHIMAIAGNGMCLETGNRPPIAIEALYRPASFSGDWQVFGRLRDGPVRDFNLMVRREFGEGRLEAIGPVRAEIAMPGDLAALFVYVAEGTAAISGSRLEQGSSLYVTERSSELVQLDGRAICCEIRPRSPFRDS
jgi:hypothetical protein